MLQLVKTAKETEMEDNEAIARVMSMTDSEIVSSLRHLVFAGISIPDYAMSSFFYLFPDRITEAAQSAVRNLENPAPLPPVFSKPQTQL